MQKRRYSLLLMLCMAVLVFFSCQKDISIEDGGTPGTTGTPIELPDPVQASVSGIVTDENDQPVPNAPVVVAGNIYTTNAKGFFNSARHTLDKNLTTVSVTMPGYFKALRSFPANANTRNYVAIKLIPKTLAGSFSSSAAGSIALPNGSQVSFTAGSIVNKSTGAAYTGTVKVFSVYIDPTSSDIGARIPGSFVGEDNSRRYGLASAGMIAVELEAPDGTALQLANGKTAAVKLLIPAALRNNAPSSINTWSLDERGVWKKESPNAAKNGNFYEWEAPHFSYWNCDIPNSSIYLSLLVTNAQGQPMANTYVDMIPTSPNLGSHAGGLTDSAGRATAFIPANEVLRLNVYNNYFCNTVLHTQLIGPFTGNSSITITVNPPPQQQLTVQGNVLNCSGAPLAAGTAIVYSGPYNVYHLPVTNGSFSYTITQCVATPTVDVVVIDNANLQQSNTATVTVNAGVANAGTLSACGVAINEFMNYTVDGTSYSIVPIPQSASLVAWVIPGTRTDIAGYEQPAGMPVKTLSFSTNGTASGSFAVRNDSLTINNYNGALPQPAASVNFTSFGPSGQFIEGSFNIPFTHSSTGATVHSCTGTFRVRRN